MNPLMGVLIVDYEHGARTLQMTGRAEIVNDSLGMPGAQRAFKFSIEEFVYVRCLRDVLHRNGTMPVFRPVLHVSPR